jgi:hypothetical protein
MRYATIADQVESQLVEEVTAALSCGMSEATREPGASDVFTQDLHADPPTAFFASNPAAIITLGLLVFVQLVIAAIRTLPCPT